MNIAHSLVDIQKIYPDAIELPGEFVFECSVCRDEGHPGKKMHGFKGRYGRITGLSCDRFIGQPKKAKRDHCEPVGIALGLSDDGQSQFIDEVLFGGTLTIECDTLKNVKALVIARNCDNELGRDVLDLNRGDHRATFMKSLEGFDADQRKQINQALLKLAGRRGNVRAAIDDEAEDKPVEKVISKILPDGRIIEQIAGGRFAVYDPERGTTDYSRKVEIDEAVYIPLDDEFILRGGLFLPEQLKEFGDNVETLDAEIEACVHRYSDVPERERKLAAKYARLSYIVENLNEISYLRATGDRGTGKSRFIGTAGMLCLRPVIITSPSAASLYRVMDAYRPTLIIDECNLDVGSEDTQVFIQILNSGFQRIAMVPRCEKGEDGQLTIRMFSPFGPKLIAGLKLSQSEAFESRCVPIELEKTTRKDIPFRLTERMLRDFADLRAKLYLWRIRNLSRDYEQALDDAEKELKNYSIEPRFIQIAIPVYGMITDEKLKADFAAMMEGRTDDAVKEKQESFDGLMVSTIHQLLFDVEYKQNDKGEDTDQVKIVRHHRQSRWLDEWGRLKGDHPDELAFDIIVASRRSVFRSDRCHRSLPGCECNDESLPR
jgi:hypothetical protein